MALVRDAVSAAGGNPDLKSLMQFYARRMPLKDVKRAKGYPDPLARVLRRRRGRLRRVVDAARGPG